MLASTSSGGVSATYAPRANTGTYSAATWSRAGGGDQSVAFDYDGMVLTAQTFTGAAAGTLTATVNNFSRTTALAVQTASGTATQARTFDDDGLRTGMGPLTLIRGGPGGETSAVTSADGKASYAQTVTPGGGITARSLTVNGVAVFSETLSLNEDRQPTSITIGGASTSYTYDTNGRLKTAGATTYTYDDDGNLSNPVAGAATYDLADRITAAGGATYTVDDSGRLVARGTDSFVYAPTGQLVSATVGGVTTTYTYDALGRRTSQTTGGQSTRFLYGDPINQGQVSAVIEANGDTDVLHYDERGILLGFQRNGTAEYYVGADHLGSVRVIADASGAVVKSTAYGAWGNVTAHTGDTFAFPIGFAGGLADPVTGLVHFGARDYAPEIGRFTTLDPVLFGGGLNLFTYVGDDPVARVDPAGLWSVGGSAYALLGAGVKFNVDSTGFSFCGEVGVGVGAQAELSNEGMQDTGMSAVAEGTVALGPASATLQGSLYSGPCRNNKASLGAKLALGPLAKTFGGSQDYQDGVPVGEWTDAKPTKSRFGNNDLHYGSGAEGKVALQACKGITW